MAYILHVDDEFGYMQKKIAALMDVSQSTISNAVKEMRYEAEIYMNHCFFSMIFYCSYGLTWSLWSSLGISQVLFHTFLIWMLVNLKASCNK